MKNKILTTLVYLIILVLKANSQSEWEIINLPINPTKIDFINLNTGFIVGYNNNQVKIYRTNNMGNSFESPINDR